MASEKLSRQISKSSIDEKSGYFSDPSSFAPTSDAASQFSKESHGERKKKGWTKSLKKATSSIIYMAMPPTSADQMPMVVAQTPMSPDRLIPTLHSPLLQSPHMSSIDFTTQHTLPSDSFMPVTTASSTSSFGSSSITSTASSAPIVRRGSKTEYHEGVRPEQVETPTSPTTAPRRQRPLSSNEPKKRLPKGKEKAGSVSTESSDQGLNFAIRAEAAVAMTLTTPVSSPQPRSHVRNTSASANNNINNNNSASAPISSTIENVPQIERRQTLPSPPPSPSNVIRRQQREAPVNHNNQKVQSTAEPISTPEQIPSEIPTKNPARNSLIKPVASDSISANANVLPTLPPNLSRLSFTLDAGSNLNNTNIAGDKAELLEESLSTHAEETQQEIVAEEKKAEEQVKEVEHKDSDEKPQLVERTYTASSIPGSFPGMSFNEPEPTPLPGSFPVRPKYKAPRPPRDNSVHIPLPGSFPVKPVFEEPKPVSSPEPIVVEPEPELVVVEPQSEPIVVEPQPKPTVVEPQPKPTVVEPQPKPIVVAPQPKSIVVAPQPKPIAVAQHPEPLVLASPKAIVSPPELSPLSLLAKERLRSFSPPPTSPLPAPRMASKEIPQTSETVAVPSPTVPVFDNASKTIPKEPKVEISAHITPSRLRKQSNDISADVSGAMMVQKRSLSLSRNLSKSLESPKTVKNVPWLWHQDGIHHQRLESHQILTKEQVFEQFHLDLEQDGPNGFFLFKLVRRFKKQDSSLLAISSSLLDAELTASPASSPSTATPTSILESLEAVSVSQRLKRQLLLQKRKKQRKPSGSNDEDENLEALLTMTNNNTSLQNLNSSLQEVIDAVENMKQAEEWTSLLNQPRQLPQIQPKAQKSSYPDSEGEYTSREKDAMDLTALEKRKGVYATGRLDGMNLIPKKKYIAAQRRSSMTGSGRKGSIASTSSTAPDFSIAQENYGSERRGSEATGESLQFKKNAVCQLHIYSRNGLKFKFDVMEDNELHFVEASKKYTFMDPLAAHRQPELDSNGDDVLQPLPLRSPTFANGRRPSTGTTVSATDGRPRRSSSSSASKNTLSSTSSAGGRRVYVTRLGRHTLLTYPEYKTLAKSASSFTLGAKLLIQRSIAVATPSFYGNGHSKDSSQGFAYESNLNGSPLKSGSTPTPSGNGESADYFSLKKKPRGFASKAVAAIKSPLSTSGANQQKSSGTRPIVTPYNPNDYKNKSLTVSNSSNGNNSGGEEPISPTSSSFPDRRGVNNPTPVAIDDSDSPFPMPPNHVSTPSEPQTPIPPTPASTASSPPPTPSSSNSNPYGSIKRQGNQAGLKFQHLFVTVHQRLQKLELENGSSFYGSSLVQWTVIEDPAELRWWRDKIGIQMIGRLDGDEGDGVVRVSPSASTAQSNRSTLSSVRASYMSSESMISDATSSSMSSRGYRTHVSVERLGYRFLRVSGHMGTMKVTVSEKVEARAVALAVRAEMIKQKRAANMSQGFVVQSDEDLSEQLWVEPADATVVSDGDSDMDGYDCDGDSDDEEGESSTKNGIPFKQSRNPSNFFDSFEYDEWTGQTKPKKKTSIDRFSRRKRHNRDTQRTAPLIERMTMIVGQSKVFKGDWYMKNVYKFYPEE
ncbi:hypothetical protein BGZ46_001358 [Entomortierella lignicola]|nr:hypothetical protein BGZ46_001358 [Entomortierella lignicola]